MHPLPTKATSTRLATPTDEQHGHDPNVGLQFGRTPVISTLGRKRQENCGFEASLGFTLRPCLKTKNHEGSSGGALAWDAGDTGFPTFNKMTEE